MKQILLAAVATIALSLPAMAQSNHTDTMQPNSQSQMGSQAQNRIEPSQLSTQQIRQVQMSLNKKGFDANKADGIWGPETDAALVNFQQKNNLPGHGRLNQQTLSALGVNVNGQSQQGSATTGSGSGEKNMQPSQNPGPMNNDSSGMHNGTTGQGSASMNRGSGNGSGNMPGNGMSGGSNSQNGTSKPSVNDGH